MWETRVTLAALAVLTFPVDVEMVEEDGEEGAVGGGLAEAVGASVDEDEVDAGGLGERFGVPVRDVDVRSRRRCRGRGLGRPQEYF